MNRLLQGDVGSGKTVVALVSMLMAVEGGYQAALMAPTEILARQHFATITKMLGDLPVQVRYKLLIGLVIPRPIAWISTWSENGVANCAPFSFFNVISEEPPLCIVSFNRRSDGAMKHTLKNIRRTGEFVVNLADEGTANAMHASGEEIPESESEFAKSGLTPVPAVLVKHPRIGEAAASSEGTVAGADLLVDGGYNARPRVSPDGRQGMLDHAAQLHAAGIPFMFREPTRAR